MLGHLTTYHACLAAALASLWTVGVPLPLPHVLVALMWSAVTHGFIDRRWPVRWLLNHTGSRPFAELAGHGINGMYLVDQSLHVACLFVASLIVGSGA